MLLSSLSCDDYLHIITCSLALCIKAPSSGLEAMRPWINLGSGFPLISSQRGQNQGGTPVHVGTPVHMGSQIMDSVSPPRVVVRRQAVPLWLRNMQDVMGTQPAPVAASQMSTIPGMSLELLSPDYAPSLAPQRTLSVSRERQGPQELQASQGSVEMRASAEFERSRSRDLQRQPAIVPQERRPVAADRKSVV